MGNGSSGFWQDKLLAVGISILIALGTWNLVQSYSNGKAIAALTAAAVARDTRLNGIESRLDRHLDRVQPQDSYSSR